MKKVSWIEFGNQENNTFLEPIPYIKFLKDKRSVSNAPYLRCPAFTDFYKNSFVILSPISFSIKPNKQHTFTVQCEEKDLYLFEEYFLNRTIVESPDQLKNNYFIVSLAPLYCFTADTPTLFEILPFSFLPHTVPISGSFDISKWIRPVDVTLEFTNPYEMISIQKGDPLLMIRFVDHGGDIIVLEKEADKDRIEMLITKCLKNKDKVKGKSLEHYYDLKCI